MNKESINNTETLENQEQNTVAVESKESGQELAEKILDKIKKYTSPLLSKQEAIEKIESSVSFNDPEVKNKIKNELNLDSQLDEIDTEIKSTQAEASDKVNLVTRDFSKAYHHPEYRKEVAKQIIGARNSGQDAEAVRGSFYDKTASEKENFESQEKERSVAEIMKDKDLVVVHAIPLFSEGSGSGRGSTENNLMIKNEMQQKVSFEDSFEMIAGLSPTISTSIPSPDRSGNGLFKKQGVILGEGKILAAHAGDSGSVAHGLYKRIPKEAKEGENMLHHSAIHTVDVEKVAPAQKEATRGEMWNELTIENPKIAGLFYDLSEPPKISPNLEYFKNKGASDSELEAIQKEYSENREKSLKSLEKEQEETLVKMKEYSKKMNVPLYAFKNENGNLNKYKVDFVSDPAITEDYLRNVMVPKSNEILSKNNRDFSSPEFLEFTKEFDRAERILEGKEYILTPVTAKNIYESKRDISDEERNKMIEDIKSKGILSDSAEKEVNKKFKDLI